MNASNLRLFYFASTCLAFVTNSITNFELKGDHMNRRQILKIAACSTVLPSQDASPSAYTQNTSYWGEGEWRIHL